MLMQVGGKGTLGYVALFCRVIFLLPVICFDFNFFV